LSPSSTCAAAAHALDVRNQNAVWSPSK
jgi:hypothetical protein